MWRHPPRLSALVPPDSLRFVSRTPQSRASFVRIVLLAVSAISLLAIGTGLSFQVSRSSIASPPVVAAAAATAPSLPAGDIAVDEDVAKVPAAPAEQPTAATVVRVRTVRIDPERPPTRADDGQDVAASAEAPPPESARTDNTSGMPRIAPSAPAPVSRTHRPAAARDKPRFVVLRKSSHAHRKTAVPADSPAANDSLSYAPKEPGPESLNPLGKLLTQGFKAN
jgi:hypothetical protein